jgi:hypothetical protein
MKKPIHFGLLILHLVPYWLLLKCEVTDRIHEGLKLARNSDLQALSQLRQVTISFVVPVRPSVSSNNSALTGRIFLKFYICVFFETLSGKLKFH